MRRRTYFSAIWAGLFAAIILLLPSSLVQAQNSVEVRFIQTAPDSGPVDIYVDSTPVFKNVSFSAISNYFAIAPGNHTIRILRGGEDPSTPSLIEATLPFVENRDYSLVLIGQNSQFELLNLEDNNTPTLENKARVRYTHAVTGGPGIDVCIVERTCFISNLNYKGSATHDLDATNYLIDIRQHNTNNVVMNRPNEPFRDGFSYACFAIGDINNPATRQIVCAASQTRPSGYQQLGGPPPSSPPNNGAILAPEIAIGLAITLLLLGTMIWVAVRYFRKIIV